MEEAKRCEEETRNGILRSAPGDLPSDGLHSAGETRTYWSGKLESCDYFHVPGAHGLLGVRRSALLISAANVSRGPTGVGGRLRSSLRQSFV
jgi:hypothetical protein